jgi:hypothetical protein
MREFKKHYYTPSMESNSADMLKSLGVCAKECRSLENVLKQQLGRKEVNRGQAQGERI